MVSIIWFLIGLVIFLFWITGHWIPALVAGIASILAAFSKGVEFPFGLIFPVIALAPIIIRHFLIKTPHPYGWGVEVRAFRALTGSARKP